MIDFIERGKKLKKCEKPLNSVCKVRKGCYIMIPVAPDDGADAWNSDLADEEKTKNLQTAAWKSKNQWYIKNPLHVECNEGCLINYLMMAERKNQKFSESCLKK